jgi:amidase
MGTEGPMGRSVRDLAQLLAIQAGPDARCPLAMTERFSLEQALNPIASNSIRVAWLGDLGGYLAMDDGITDTCRASLASWENSGIRLDDKSREPAVFGMENASLWQSWLAWRSALVGQRLEPMMSLAPNARDQIKPEALWEFDQSHSMGVAQFAKASALRSTFYANCAALFEKYDVLALPSAQVWPFAVEERWPATIADRSMDTYHRWMEATIYATLLGAPAVCMPAGFDKANRLPMGIQFIGRPGADAQILQIAAHYEAWMREHQSAWYLRKP